MRRLLATAVLALSLFIAGAPSVSAQTSCPTGTTTKYCYCTFGLGIAPPQCRGEQKHIKPVCVPAGGDAQADAACKSDCARAGTDASGKPLFFTGTLVSVYAERCDVDYRKDCKGQVSGHDGASCSSCYCTWPSGACAGKTAFVGVTQKGAPSCDAKCRDIGGFGPGSVIAESEPQCDFAPSADGRTCQLKDAATAPAKCKQSGGAAGAAGGGASRSPGSVISTPGPLSTTTLPQLIGKAINAVFSVIGAVAFLMFIYGGFTWMTAAGNEKRIASGRATIVWAALGLMLIFGAYAVVSAVIRGVTTGQADSVAPATQCVFDARCTTAAECFGNICSNGRCVCFSDRAEPSEERPPATDEELEELMNSSLTPDSTCREATDCGHPEVWYCEPPDAFNAALGRGGTCKKY